MIERRLPIYFVLDCSESMVGEGLSDMTAGLESIVTALRKHPLAMETANLSVISFSKDARVEQPLTDLMDFELPSLSVSWGTALGGALRLLKAQMEREIVPTTPEQKGDYRPFVFLFTDGQPTDDWKGPATDLANSAFVKLANLYAIGCGPDVDTDVLLNVTDIVYLTKDSESVLDKNLFFWLTNTILTASKSVASGSEDYAAHLPEAPSAVLERVRSGSHYRDTTPRQLFLLARCTETKKPYLMRFRREGDAEAYSSICAHILDESFDDDEASAGATVNTANLLGCPPCPYCESPAATVCECGALICFDGAIDQPMICPVCEEMGTVQERGPDGGRNICQRLG